MPYVEVVLFVIYLSNVSANFGERGGQDNFFKPQPLKKKEIECVNVRPLTNINARVCGSECVCVCVRVRACVRACACVCVCVRF